MIIRASGLSFLKKEPTHEFDERHSELEQRGLKVISLQGEGADGETMPLAEIDPFTILASGWRSYSSKEGTCTLARLA